MMLNSIKLSNFPKTILTTANLGVYNAKAFAAAWLHALGTTKVAIPVLLGLFLSEASFSADYYVATSGSDKNPGTEARPFRNPQAAGNIVKPGDTVYLKNGTYPANADSGRVLNLSRSGTADNMITFKNYPGHKPRIGRLPANTADQYGFVTVGADYIRIEGLAFVGTEQKCVYIASKGANGSKNIEIVGNTFDRCGRAHKSCGDQTGHSAITTGPYTNGTLIANNTIRDSGRVINSACDTLKSTKNHQYRHDHAVYLKGKGHIFRNNVVLDYPAGMGVKIDGYTKTLARTVAPDFSHIIVNNTFGKNTSVQPYDYVSGGPVGIYNSTPDSHNPRWLIANNIFLEPVRSQSNEPTAVLIRDNSAQNHATDNECRNNIVTGKDAIAACGENIPAVVPNVKFKDNVLGETLANLDFVSVKSGNYHIGASSSAIGRGDPTIAPAKGSGQKLQKAQAGKVKVDVGAYQSVSQVPPPVRAPAATPNPPLAFTVED